jgi:hypothetical protein
VRRSGRDEAAVRAGRDRTVAALALAFSLLAAACRPTGREEAARVLRALGLLRDAPADRKQVPAEALAKLPCSFAVVCSARDRCASVYRHLADAEGQMQAMKEKIALDPPRTARAIGELTEQLDRAEVEVEGFRRELGGCEEAVSRMRRVYGI